MTECPSNGPGTCAAQTTAAQERIREIIQGRELPYRDPDPLVAAGGWSCPSDLFYDAVADAAALNLNEYAWAAFPEVTTTRGGFDFTDRRTDAEKAATDRMAKIVARLVGNIAEAQVIDLDTACLEALREGWDVHVHRRTYQPTNAHPGSVRFFGIELAPRTTGLSIPTIYEHADDWRWETLEDDGWPQ